MAEQTNKSIYEKLAEARSSFHRKPLKKSGHNKFAGYYYFELGDFVVEAMESLKDFGLMSFISYGKDVASITVREFSGDGVITIESPMSSAALKGCHEVQNLGAVETYIRRYLWVTLMEVIENDAVDSTERVEPQRSTNYKQELVKLCSKNGIVLTVLEKYLKDKGLEGKEDGVIANWSKASLTLKTMQQEASKLSDENPF